MPTLEETREKVTELKNLLTSDENTTGNLARLKELLLTDRILAFATRDDKGKSEIMTEFLRSEIITQNPDLLKKTLSVKTSGFNEFLCAALFGNTKAVKALLSNNIITEDSNFFEELVTSKLSGGFNALALAAQYRKPEIVKAILNINTQDQNSKPLIKKLLKNRDGEGGNALICAGNAETLRAFLESPILLEDSNFLKELLDNKDIQDNKDIHYNNAFVKAAIIGNFEVVTELLKHDYQDKAFRIRFLSDKDKYDNKNALALAMAGCAYSEDAHTKVVTALLEHGSQDPDLLRMLLSDRDKEGRNALGSTVFNGDTKTVKAFLDSDIFAQNPDLLKELLNNKDNRDRNVLALAQSSRAPDMKEILLGHEYENPTPSGEALNHQDIKGNSEPPASAIISNLGKMTEPPLQKGPNVSDLTNKIIEKIKSPRSENLSEFFQSLKEEEKEILVQAINTPVFLNLSSGSTFQKLFYRSEPPKDSKHRTPLQVAAELGNVDVMKLLIEKGADVNAVNKDKSTALKLAKKYNKKDAVNFLENLVPSSSVSEVFTINPIYEGKGKEGGGRRK
jgi:ankyrin repeat protein